MGGEGVAKLWSKWGKVCAWPHCLSVQAAPADDIVCFRILSLACSPSGASFVCSAAASGLVNQLDFAVPDSGGKGSNQVPGKLLLWDTKTMKQQVRSGVSLSFFFFMISSPVSSCLILHWLLCKKLLANTASKHTASYVAVLSQLYFGRILSNTILLLRVLPLTLSIIWTETKYKVACCVPGANILNCASDQPRSHCHLPVSCFLLGPSRCPSLPP